MAERPELSVVLPAYNEAAALPQAIERLRQVLTPLTDRFELIVVDDGSSDATYHLVRTAHAADGRVKGVRLARNFGKEAALQAGLAAATGQAVATLDADLQHPPELLAAMLHHWRNGAKVVHGVKRRRGAESRWMGLAARLFYRSFHRLTGLDLRSSSDLKLLDREIVDLLLQQLPERSRFYRGLVFWVGLNDVTVEFDVQPRVGGVTHWQLGALVGYASRAITAFSSLPLQLVPLLGALMLLVALVLGLEAFVSRLSGAAVSGFATLEITVLFTGSLVMIGLGIIGQYLARIYEEVKMRPHYVVREQLGWGDHKHDQRPLEPADAP